MTRSNLELPPSLMNLPVDFNHWGEPIQRDDFRQMLAERVLLKGLQAYAWHRIRPGSFLQACLANDFRDAACRADFSSQWLLTQIALYIHNHMPATCHGSREAVDDWVEGRTADQIATAAPRVEVDVFTSEPKGAPQT